MKPFDEGETAGFLGTGRHANPYALRDDAKQWDDGYSAGVENARAALIEKRRDACQ